MEEIIEELQMLDDALMEIHDRIRSGRCLTNKQQTQRMVDFLQLITNKDEGMSKEMACKYVGMKRPTFDRYVAAGKLPKGKKRLGFTELFWYAKDLDKYIDEIV